MSIWRPNSDQSVGNWNSSTYRSDDPRTFHGQLWPRIDETTPDDSDYAWLLTEAKLSEQAATFIVNLREDPKTAGKKLLCKSATISYRAKATTDPPTKIIKALGDPSIKCTTRLTVSLLSKNLVLGTPDTWDLPTSFQERQFTVTFDESQFDPESLQLKVTGSITDDMRFIYFSWTKVEVP
jgi:hypothetical protein